MEWFEYFALQRKRNNLSFSQIAQLTSLDSYDIFLIENGKKEIDLYMVNDFCKVFNVSLNNFVDQKSGCDNMYALEYSFDENHFVNVIKNIKLEKDDNEYFKKINNLKYVTIADFAHLTKKYSLDVNYLFYGIKNKAKKNNRNTIFITAVTIVLIVGLLLYLEYQLNIFGFFEDYYNNIK